MAFNKSATNTLRLFYNKEDLQHFFDGFQAKYWNQHGSPFVQISPEKCKEMVPELGKCYEQSSKNRTKVYIFSKCWFYPER